MIRSQWSTHTTGTHRDVEYLEARRCTVQLSTGRLYLDAAATPMTALLGHDLPPVAATDAPTVQSMLSALATGYVCLTMTASCASAADFAARVGRAATGTYGRVVEINALDGEPVPGNHLDNDLLVVQENETLGRTGRWLASVAWGRAPDLVVVGEALALGSPFGAVLARDGLAGDLNFAEICPSGYESAHLAVLARAAAAIATVETEGLLRQGRELANYLTTRLLAMRETCPQIESVEGTGLSFRIAFTLPAMATQIRRRMCERGVLAGVDGEGRLAIDPPLPLRIAEADVITGTLRGAILGLPVATSSACCAACEHTS